jgi:hypothetical protein
MIGFGFATAFLSPLMEFHSNEWRKVVLYWFFIPALLTFLI